MKTFEELQTSRNIKDCVEYWNDNELNKEDATKLLTIITEEAIMFYFLDKDAITVPYFGKKKEDDAMLKLKWKEGLMNIQTSKKPNGTLGIGWLE